MPRFAANLSMMYAEVPFLDRFAACARDGFEPRGRPDKTCLRPRPGRASALGAENGVDELATAIIEEEVDIVDALFEHRMLLWPEGEVGVRFRTLTVERVGATPDERRTGKYTSDELPRGMSQVPYDFPGDPELGQQRAGRQCRNDIHARPVVQAEARRSPHLQPVTQRHQRGWRR